VSKSKAVFAVTSFQNSFALLV